MLETTGQTHTKELYVAEATKQCTKCKETLPLNSFHKYKETFRSHCKACRVLENIETHKRNNPKRMWVDGKYIPMTHPLHKPGRYKGFEEAAFSSLQNYKSSKEGEVYIITNPAFEGWVKVGMAVDATDRLKGYQTSSPFRDYELQFFCKVKDRRASESQAHQLLASKFHQQGEWFQCSIEEARQVINQVKLESE
jgi:hypothetical protein